jgi:hypothetical protein
MKARVTDDGQALADQRLESEGSGEAGGGGATHIAQADELGQDARNRALAAAPRPDYQEHLLLRRVTREAISKPFLQQVERLQISVK